MLTYKQISDGIKAKIKTKYPSIPIQTIDSKEGLKRPSFRVNLDDIKVSNFMELAKDRDMTIRVYFFPTDEKKYRTEMLDIQDGLDEIFINDNMITLDNTPLFEIWDSDVGITDGVLHYYMDIQLYESFNKPDDGELMEDIEI